MLVALQGCASHTHVVPVYWTVPSTFPFTAMSLGRPSQSPMARALTRVMRAPGGVGSGKVRIPPAHVSARLGQTQPRPSQSGAFAQSLVSEP